MTTSSNRHKRRTKRKKKKRINYRRNVKKRKKEVLDQKIRAILNDGVVVNLPKVDLPDGALLFLAKGLSFVPTYNTSKENLTFDLLQFHRKIAWKAYHHELRSENSNEGWNNNIHKDLYVKKKGLPNYENPLLDEIKMKLLNFAESVGLAKPKRNLSVLELQGRKWLLGQVKNKTLYINHADKGGAILVMGYDIVQSKLDNEILNSNNFTRCPNDNMKEIITDKVKDSLIKLEHENIITNEDKELICGLNANNNMKHSPKYQSVDPHVEPLFKLHKLSRFDIDNKVIPPFRLVSSAHNGPLYRMEKWLSPYLSSLSQSYLGDEYLQDTPHLTSSLPVLNGKLMTFCETSNFNLSTLDVVQLYPSIDPSHWANKQSYWANNHFNVSLFWIPLLLFLNKWA